jgi:hypothetical protein
MFLLGRHGEAEHDLDEAIDLDVRTGSPNFIVWLLFRIDLARFRGDAASALRDMSRVGERVRMDAMHDRRIAAASIGLAQCAAGSWREAVATLRELPGFGSGVHWVRTFLGQALLECGDVDAARAAAQAAVTEFSHRNPMAELPAQLVLAQVLRRIDGVAARPAIEAALARAAALIAETGAVVYAPELHVERAALAQLLGDSEGHGRELREAQRLYAEMGARLRVAEIERALRGAHDDAEAV